jgi:hypothetical protein
VEAESAEYWVAKAKLTGERYSGGENETVDL